MARIKLLPDNYNLEDTGMLVTIGNQRFINEYDAEVLLSLLKHANYVIDELEADNQDLGAKIEDLKYKLGQSNNMQKQAKRKNKSKSLTKV